MSKKCPVCNGAVLEQDNVCPHCGFKLIESTQEFRPVALSGEEMRSPKIKPVESAVLRVIRGPQIEAIFPLEGQSYSIGRSPQCDIFLNDMTVSRLHANITREDAGYRLEDANSFNGVWVNNESVDSIILKEGDIVQIGAFCLIYHENVG